MASIWITERKTSTGSPRFDVKFEGPPTLRLDGSYRAALHVGTFKTLKLAEMRRDWAEKEWAAGRAPDPRRILQEQMPQHTRRMQAVVDDWIASRRDIAPRTRVSYKRWSDEIVRAFPSDPAIITPADVRDWIGDMDGSGFKGGTIGLAVTILGMILDHADVAPNPVRHKSVKVPATGGPRIRLPSTNELVSIRGAMRRDHYRLLLDFLEDTGCRISEACALQWDAVHTDRILIPGVKGKAGKVKPRWIDEDLHPIRLMYLDRGEGKVFGATVKGFTAALYAACDKAGVQRYSPHDLRHLHLSRLMQSTNRHADVAARAGHANPKILISTYTHVVPRE